MLSTMDSNFQFFINLTARTTTKSDVIYLSTEDSKFQLYFINLTARTIIIVMLSTEESKFCVVMSRKNALVITAFIIHDTTSKHAYTNVLLNHVFFVANS